MEPYDRAFEGNFKDVDFIVSNIDLLIKQNILVVSAPVVVGVEFDRAHESYAFSLPYFTSTGTYNLNQVILDNIYKKLLWLAESAVIIDDFFLNKYHVKITALLNRNDKLKYLENQNKKHYSKIESFSEYLLYAEQKKFNNWANWYEMMVDVILSNQELICAYLSDGLDYYVLHKDILKQWTQYYKIKKLTAFFKNEITQIQGVTIQTTEKSTQTDLESIRIEDLLIQKGDKIKQIPYRIALFHEIGFFDLPIFEEMKKEKLYGITALLLGLDFNNKNTIRAISGNINVLKLDSTENPTKYTALSNIPKVKELLKNKKGGFNTGTPQD